MNTREHTPEMAIAASAPTRRPAHGRHDLVRLAVAAAMAVAAATIGLAAAPVAPQVEAQVPPPVATYPSHDVVVSADPAPWTPHILDGAVKDIAQVGDLMVVGGDFTQVAPPQGSPIIPQPNVFAFDATDGTISSTFTPSAGGEILAVEAGPIPGTVYIAGGAGGVNGQNGRVFLVNVSDGTLVPGFDDPPLNGRINDLVLIDGTLYAGGTFTIAAGLPYGGLIALDPLTGAIDPKLNVILTENHSWTPGSNSGRAPVGAFSIDVDPAATTLAVVGNFREADGLDRRQMVLIDLTQNPAVVRPDWRTLRYYPTCSRRTDTYMRDITFSPDGEYVHVATTGGPNPGTLCDTATQWDISEVDLEAEPMWIDDTGGDTLLSIASSGSAVYTGGHQRWLNNPGGRDRAVAGAVPRPGIGAMDTENGVPLSWNPGRNPRGVGAEVVEVTDAGLWVGSDTDFIGYFQLRRPRLAFFPVEGGTDRGAEAATALPANVYLGSDGGPADLSRIWFQGSTVDPGDLAPSAAGDIDWSTVTGAFMVDDSLYYATSANEFLRRTFDGQAFGPVEVIDPYNDPFWSDKDAGRTLYRGVQPTFYGETDTLTGLAYLDSRLYSTRTGSGQIFVRDFAPESGIMAEATTTVSGFDVAGVGNIFFDPAAGLLYFVDLADGSLYSIAFADDTVSGPSTLVSGPATDGMDWRSDSLFVGPGPAPTPTAAISTSCDMLTCDLSGAGSSDPDGTVVSWDWDLGDGTTASGENISHTYAAEGTYTVSLTVTDDDGFTDTTTDGITVADIAAPDAVGVSAAREWSVTPSVTVPATVQSGDLLLFFFSTNQNAQGTGPDGVGPWTEQNRTINGALATSVFTRLADGSEAGQDITMTLPSRFRSDLTVIAYRGATGIDDLAITTDQGTSTHTTPAVTSTGAARTEVSYWADRSSSTSTWTAPTGVDVLSTQVGTEAGRVTTLVADRTVDTGTHGGITATTNAPAARAITIALTLTP
ncbi:MAG: PKD domain-containing protein, partial [Ilumatobacter sp.]